jgi:hypothetical protein
MDGLLGEQRLHLGRINKSVCAATLNGNERIKIKTGSSPHSAI